MSDLYDKVSAYQCSFCGSLHEHPALAERCGMKCKWEQLAEAIAVERENNKKLEKGDMLESLERELQEHKSDSPPE